jgi:arylsulfatase A-like enzyme
VRPNIVFIMADDLGYADLSCCGRRDFSTPNIDRIAERGIRFTQAYANSAVCSATRLALITGRYQYRLPLGLEEPLAGKTDVGLPPEHPTLPSLLRDAGYATALVGKWHLGMPPKFGPLKSGYDQFWGIRTGAIDYYSHRNARGEDDLWDGDVAVHQSGYLTDLLGDRAVETIERFAADRRPFLLSLHFTAPHWPWEAPGDQSESERLLGSRLRHYDGGTLATYARMVQAMDRQVGRVLQALDVNGLSGNTVVVFTSDNGGERFSDTWPFTGVKTELLEGGLRVPALMCWPDRIRAGQTSEQVTITMDWLPTLLEAAETEPDAAYSPDGISLLPVLTGRLAAASRRLFWRYKTNAQRAARDGDFKYLKIRDNTFLFDVVADPRERANLKERRRDVFERLVADWTVWNADMLGEIPDSFGEVFTAAELADHIGT